MRSILAQYIPTKLHSRLGLVQSLLLIFILVGQHYAIISVNRLVDEATRQQLYAPLAARMASDLSAQFEDDKPYTELLDQLRERYQLIEASAYVLGSDGHILGELTPGLDSLLITKDAIPVSTIERYLTEGPNRFLPLYGPDPVEGKTTFVAGRLRLPSGAAGYLYLPLSAPAKRVARSLAVEVAGTAVALAVILSSILAGSAAAAWLSKVTTRRYANIHDTILKCAAGEFGQRIPVKGRDELSELGQAVNSMAEALIARDEERRAMLNGISHDLTGPVSVLAAYTDALVHTPEILKASDVTRWANVYQKNVDFLQALLLELTELTVLNRSLDEVALEPHPLGELLENVVQGFITVGANRGVKVSLLAVHESVYVQCVPIGVTRVVSNLLSNALRHTPQGGEIVVSTIIQDHQAIVRIHDDGEGIPPERLDAIRQGTIGFDSQPKRARGLAGLGLSICRDILRRHSSELVIESTGSEGSSRGGSTFSFTLRRTTLPAHTHSSDRAPKSDDDSEDTSQPARSSS